MYRGGGSIVYRPTDQHRTALTGKLKKKKKKETTEKVAVARAADEMIYLSRNSE